MSSPGTGFGSTTACRSATGGEIAPRVTQPLASQSARRRTDRLIRLSCDRIVKLLLVLVCGDGILSTLVRRLVVRALSLLLDLLFVLVDDASVV